MEFIIDDPRQEQVFRQILKKIQLAKNGETVDQMKQHGITYKTSWGASIISFRKDEHKLLLFSIPLLILLHKLSPSTPAIVTGKHHTIS